MSNPVSPATEVIAALWQDRSGSHVALEFVEADGSVSRIGPFTASSSQAARMIAFDEAARRGFPNERFPIAWTVGPL